MRNLALLLSVAAACGGSSTSRSSSKPTKRSAAASAAPAAAPEGDLYDRLGGQRAIVAVVDDFIGRVAADTRINQRFANTDIPKLKLLLVEFVCMATGGPCKYTGIDMETSHGGMEVVDEEFTALVEDLVGTLDAFKVPDAEKDALLGALGPLKPRIVTPKERLHPVDEKLLARATAVQDLITSKQTRELMGAAIVAARRGQRNWADQLFTRVESLEGAKVADAIPAFRNGAPPRVETPLEHMATDAPAQPRVVGASEDDGPAPKSGASLKGTITVDGKPLDGVGLVELYPIGQKYAKRIPKKRVVEQRNKTFSPRLLAVPPGSTVAFPNYDSFYHNVFSTSSTQPFDIGSFKAGNSRSMKFDKPGLIRLGCNVHASMAAFIFVIDAPAYVPVDGAKEFNFRSIAPGKYKARVWSEHSKEATELVIKIKDGVNTIVFDLKDTAEKGPSNDKFGNSRVVER